MEVRSYQLGLQQISTVRSDELWSDNLKSTSKLKCRPSPYSPYPPPPVTEACKLGDPSTSSLGYPHISGPVVHGSITPSAPPSYTSTPPDHRLYSYDLYDERYIRSEYHCPQTMDQQPLAGSSSTVSCLQSFSSKIAMYDESRPWSQGSGSSSTSDDYASTVTTHHNNNNTPSIVVPNQINSYSHNISEYFSQDKYYHSEKISYSDKIQFADQSLYQKSHYQDKIQYCNSKNVEQFQHQHHHHPHSQHQQSQPIPALTAPAQQPSTSEVVAQAITRDVSEPTHSECIQSETRCTGGNIVNINTDSCSRQMYSFPPESESRENTTTLPAYTSVIKDTQQYNVQNEFVH